MSSMTPQAYQEAYESLYMHRLHSSQTQWRRSKSHIHRCSVEMLTGSLPDSCSAASSGYWEDYDSLGASAHEITVMPQCYLRGSSRHYRSCTAIYPNCSPKPASAENIMQTDNNISSRNLMIHSKNNSGSLDEEDRLQSPKSVAIKIPAPTLRNDASMEILQTRSQSHLDIYSNETSEKTSVKTETKSGGILPRQRSDPTKGTEYPVRNEYEPDEIPTSKSQQELTIRFKRGKMCASCDLSDSDNDADDSEDECNSADDRPEPRTLFEAALRRARLAESQREVNISSGSVTGRLMPDWGSPIRWNRSNRNSPSPVFLTTETEEEISHTSSDPSDQNRSQNVRSAGEYGKNEPESPDLSCQSPNRDWCSGIETWLDTRPRWLYQIQSIDKSALQLCYLSESDQEMWTSTDTDHCFVDESSTCEADRDNQCTITREAVEIKPYADIPSQPVNDTHSNPKACVAQVIRGQLFRDENQFEEIKSRLENVDQYCELYFKQRTQGCGNEDVLSRLNLLQEKCRATHNEVQISLIQATKIARMQLELERPAWSVVPPDVAKLLEVNVRNRTLLSTSYLTTLKSSKLRLIVDGLHSAIKGLNTCLMDSLMERDELHLEHRGMLVELDDLIAHLKELCIKVSIRQYRKQISVCEAEDVPTKTNVKQTNAFNRKHDSCSDLPPRVQWNLNQDRKFSTTTSPLTLKQRFINAFSRQNFTT